MVLETRKTYRAVFSEPCVVIPPPANHPLATPSVDLTAVSGSQDQAMVTCDCEGMLQDGTTATRPVSLCISQTYRCLHVHPIGFPSSQEWKKRSHEGEEPRHTAVTAENTGRDNSG
jgi:hypothetical protein